MIGCLRPVGWTSCWLGGLLAGLPAGLQFGSRAERLRRVFVVVLLDTRPPLRHFRARSEGLLRPNDGSRTPASSRPLSVPGRTAEIMNPPQDQRSLEPEPAAVDLCCAPPGCALPGRAPPPLELAAEAGSARQRSATLPIQLRLSLVMARDCTEAQIANAQRILRTLSSDPALFAARLTIRDCLKEAAAQSARLPRNSLPNAPRG